MLRRWTPNALRVDVQAVCRSGMVMIWRGWIPTLLGQVDTGNGSWHRTNQGVAAVQQR